MRSLMPLGLAFIMFSLGLGLRVRDFRRVLRRPGVLVAGLFAQMVWLPLTGLLIARLLDLSTQWVIGLMILAACPGGVTADMFTRLAGGETALSISLTILTSLLAFVSVHLVVGMSLDFFGAGAIGIRLPVGMTASMLVLVTLLPLMLGIWLGEREVLGATTRRRVHAVASVVFVLIVLSTFYHQWPTISAHVDDIGLATLLLNLTTVGMAALLGSLLGVSAAARVALMSE